MARYSHSSENQDKEPALKTSTTDTNIEPLGTIYSNFAQESYLDIGLDPILQPEIGQTITASFTDITSNYPELTRALQTILGASLPSTLINELNFFTDMELVNIFPTDDATNVEKEIRMPIAKPLHADFYPPLTNHVPPYIPVKQTQCGSALPYSSFEHAYSEVDKKDSCLENLYEQSMVWSEPTLPAVDWNSANERMHSLNMKSANVMRKDAKVLSKGVAVTRDPDFKPTILQRWRELASDPSLSTEKRKLSIGSSSEDLDRMDIDGNALLTATLTDNTASIPTARRNLPQVLSDDETERDSLTSSQSSDDSNFSEPFEVSSCKKVATKAHPLVVPPYLRKSRRPSFEERGSFLNAVENDIVVKHPVVLIMLGCDWSPEAGRLWNGLLDIDVHVIRSDNSTTKLAKDITHVVTNDDMIHTLYASFAALRGAWILPVEWAEACIASQQLVPEENFKHFRAPLLLIKNQQFHVHNGEERDSIFYTWQGLLKDSGGIPTSAKEAKIVLFAPTIPDSDDRRKYWDESDVHIVEWQNPVPS